MINVNELKSGLTIQYEGNIYMVLDYQHVKPGKGAAIVKAKLRNLRTGSIAEYTFNAGIKIPTTKGSANSTLKNLPYTSELEKQISLSIF